MVFKSRLKYLFFLFLLQRFFYGQEFLLPTKPEWIRTPTFSDTPEKVLSPNVSYNYGYSVGLVDGVTFDSFFNFYIGPHKTTGDHHIFPLIRVGYVTSLLVPTIQTGVGYHYENLTATIQYVLGLPFLRDGGDMVQAKLVRTKEQYEERILSYLRANIDVQFWNLKLTANLWYGSIYQTFYVRNKTNPNEPEVEVVSQPILRQNVRFDILYYSDLYNDLYISGAMGLTYNTRWHNFSLSGVVMLKFNLLMTGWGELLIYPRIQSLYNSAPDKVYDRLSLFSLDNQTEPNPIVRTIDFSAYTGDMTFSIPFTYRIFPFFWLDKWQASPFKGIYFATTFHVGLVWRDVGGNPKNARFGYAFLESIGYRAYKMDLNISLGIGYSPQKEGRGIVFNFLNEL